MTTTLDRPALLAPDIDDDATRREFIAGLTALGLLAACGSDDRDDDAGTREASTSGDARQSVETARGVVDAPARPDRLLALDLLTLDTALALDVPVAGAAFQGPDDPDVDPPQRPDGGIRPILAADGISLEQVALAEPDLILAAADAFYDHIYPELSEIAPTVLHPSSATPDAGGTSPWSTPSCSPDPMPRPGCGPIAWYRPNAPGGRSANRSATTVSSC